MMMNISIENEQIGFILLSLYIGFILICLIIHLADSIKLES